MTIKAIETQYKGYRFRSRLEARWAVFFDAIGVKWEYEKEGYTFAGYSYLPDFYLPVHDLFVEIKGQDLSQLPANEDKKLRAFARHINKPLFIACGMPAERGDFYYYSTLHGNHPEWESEDDLFDPGMTIAGALKCAFLEKHNIDPHEFIFQVEIPIDFMGMANKFGGYVAARSARFEHGESPE